MASAKQNIGWNPNPPLNVAAVFSLFSEWTSTSDASMSNMTGSVPAVADDRDHTWARSAATAPATLCRSGAVTAARVHATVVSDGTAPNKPGPERSTRAVDIAFPLGGDD